MAATARLEARVPQHVHDMLKRAADLQGRTLSDFVSTAAQGEAARVIEQMEVIRLSAEDQRRFVEMMLAPPKPMSPALEEARRLHARMIVEG